MGAKLRDLEIKTLKCRGEEIHSMEMKLDELAQIYIQYKKRKFKNSRIIHGDLHLKLLASKLNNEWLPMLATVPIMQLTANDFERVHALYDGKAVATQNRYMDYLNTMLNYGVRLEYIDKNPMANWWRQARQRETPRELIISLDEFRCLYKHAPPHLQWVLEVMWETGARPGITELFSLMWKDVNWDAKTLRIRGTKTYSSDRVIPISEDFKQRLTEKRKEAQTEYLIEYKSKPIKGVKTSLTKTKKRANVHEKLCLYHLRHLFTSTMLANGADIRAVAGLLGHTSPQMIIRTYYHELSGERKRAIHCKPALA